MDIGAISGLLTSAKAAAELATMLTKMDKVNEVNRVSGELRQQILSLIDKLLDAKMVHADLMDKVRQLEKEKAEFENFGREIEDYEFCEPWPGCIVYARKNIVERPQPPHYLCANCVADRKKSILQTAEPARQGWTRLQCARCASTLITNTMGPPQLAYPPLP